MIYLDLVFFVILSGVVKDLFKNFVKNNFFVIDLLGDYCLFLDVYFKWYKKLLCIVDI